MPDLFRRRLLILCGTIALGGIVLLGRLAQVQLIWHGRFEDSYRRSRAGDKTLETLRGGIFTRDGVPLARDVVSFDLCVHYERLKDAEWLDPVRSLTGENPDELRARAREIVRRVQRIWRVVKENTGMEHLRIAEQEAYHPVVENVSAEIAALVRTRPERFEGMRIVPSARRVYPQGDLAPQVVGRCASLSPSQWEELKRRKRTWHGGLGVQNIGSRYRQDDTIGVSGLERAYETELRGRRGYVEHYLSFHPLRVERHSRTTAPIPGHDIHLTIRTDFQRAVREAFEWAAGQPRLAFESGALVVMDVRTGAILASGTYPTYDRRTFEEHFERIRANPLSPLLYRPTQAALPTGSVYKPLTAIAALEEGEITPATVFRCQGRVRFRRRWFHCTGHHGSIRLRRAIERSCNAYFFQVAERLSGEDLARWGRKFGLGSPTGVDMPFEKSGSIPVPQSLFARLNLAIGQGKLLCTPLQVARAMGAIANGGTLIQPHYLHHISDREGKVIRHFEPEMRTIDLSEKVLEAVREGMHDVTGPRGTARHAPLRQFDAAGKTGTAELGPGQPNHAWFAGFAPYDEPKVSFAVVSERNPGHGGSHAAPILARVLEKIWPEIERMP